MIKAKYGKQGRKFDKVGIKHTVLPDGIAWLWQLPGEDRTQILLSPQEMPQVVGAYLTTAHNDTADHCVRKDLDYRKG